MDKFIITISAICPGTLDLATITFSVLAPDLESAAFSAIDRILTIGGIDPVIVSII